MLDITKVESLAASGNCLPDISHNDGTTPSVPVIIKLESLDGHVQLWQQLSSTCQRFVTMMKTSPSRLGIIKLMHIDGFA